MVLRMDIQVIEFNRFHFLSLTKWVTVMMEFLSTCACFSHCMNEPCLDCQFFHLSYSIGTENGQNAMEEMFRFAYKIKPHA